jgi:hypothetical protein
MEQRRHIARLVGELNSGERGGHPACGSPHPINGTAAGLAGRLARLIIACKLPRSTVRQLPIAWAGRTVVMAAPHPMRAGGRAGDASSACAKGLSATFSSSSGLSQH